MKLGVNLGYWGAGNDADNLEVAREADRLGYAVAWAAEAEAWASASSRGRGFSGPEAGLALGVPSRPEPPAPSP